jgi:hypothetical protein
MSAVPLAPPPATSILSFSLTITGIALTPTTGSDISVPLTAATTYVVDTTKLQSDSALIGQALVMVPAGTYNKITLAVSTASVSYCTQPSPGTPGCSAGSVTTLNAPMSTPSSPITLTLAANDKQGLRVGLNIAPTLTLSGQTITALTLSPTTGTVLTAVALPPAKSSLASGQLDFVEDFTGIVTTVSGSAVTVTTSQHGAIAATANSSTSFSPSCLTTGIGTAQDLTCVKVGQLASIDAALNADGTFVLLEYDPFPLAAAAASDWIEGTVTYVPTSLTQFQIVPTDAFLKPTASLVGATLVASAAVTVNLDPGVQFLVDDKGQNVPMADSTIFTSSTDTSALKPGQTVAVRLTSFTPSAGPTFAFASTDRVMLRFTRVTGSVSLVAAPNTFSIQNLPPYFGTNTPTIVQLNQTVVPSRAATNYDGVTDASFLAVNDTVSIRAIYFPTSTTQPFSAAKVRKQ